MKDHFDKVKKRMQDYESPLNLDEEWSAFQDSSNNRLKKRRLSWLFVLLFVGSCGSCLWLGRHLAQGNYKDQLVYRPLQNTPQNGVEAGTVPGSIKSKTRSAVKATPVTPQHTLLVESAPVLERTREHQTGIQTKNTEIPGETASRLVYFLNSEKQLLEMPVEVNPSSSGIAEQHDLVPPLTELGEKPLASFIRESAPLSVKIPLDPVKKYSKKKTAGLTLYAGGGVGLNAQKFKAASNDDKDYAALRESSETMLPGFTVEMGLSKRFAGNFYVDAALHVDQWYTRMEHRFETNKTYTLNNVLLGVVQYQPIGTEVKRYGDTTVTGMQRTDVVQYNQYQTANLRLAAGAGLWQRNRWSLAFTAGLEANVYRSANGKVADPLTGIRTLEAAQYRSSLGLIAYTDVRLGYRLSRHWGLECRPSSRWYLQNTLSEAEMLKSRFRQHAAQLALLYRF